MPGPVSRTDTWKEPLFASALMATSPASVNLIALPTRFDQDLGQAAAIAAAWRQFGSHFDLEGELLVGRQRLQCAADRLGNVLNAVIGKFENQLAGLDLGQIEHVIDQSKQVPAVGLKALEYAQHLL